MQIVIVKDFFEMSRKVASLVIHHLQSHPNSVLGLPTGNTPIVFYRELVEAHKKGKIDFQKVRVFNLDEYVGLGAEHWGSYAFYMKNKLYSRVNLPPSQMNIPNGLAKDLNKESERYESAIQKVGGLDLTILGVGENGHIAFNEPGTSFSSLTHVATLTKSTLENNAHDFGEPSMMPKKALTMGLRTISESKKIIVMASGPRKADAVDALVNGPLTKKMPASILQTHEDVTLIVDEAAARELKKHGYTDQREKDFTIYHEHTLPTGKNIAVIAPHPDDCSISSGGTISMLAKHNKVTIFNMTAGHRAYIPGLSKKQKINQRKKEAFAEAKELGADCEWMDLKFYDQGTILESDIHKLLSRLKKCDPEIVFLSPVDDPHPTHKISTDLATKVLKKLVDQRQHGVELWYYESPWALFQPGKFNAVVQLSQKSLSTKLKAVRKHTSQISRTPFDEVSKAMAIMRASVVPEQILGTFGNKPPEFSRYAEIFSIRRIRYGKGLVESFSGVRGIYGTDLTEEIAEAYGYAYGTWLKLTLDINPKVVVGRDSRPSGKSLEEAMIRGLERAHCHIFKVGIGTTPMIQFEVRNRDCHGGVIVTASHNEPDWNGFKFLWGDGGTIKPEQMDEVIRSRSAGEKALETPFSDHYILFIDRAIGKHIVEKIRKAKFKAVVDPNGGAMIVMIKRLFEHMNVKTIEVNMDLGVFKHKVEPTKEALTHLGPLVTKHKADFGVAWDCDGDRVEIVMHNGKLLSGHYVLALLVDEVLSERVQNNAVVVNCGTSQVVDEVAKSHGAKVYETNVGEVNVVRKMDQVKAPVGGEGACGGGIVPPSRGRDGVLTLFKILGLMAKRRQSLASIIKTYPTYYTFQKNLRLTLEDYQKLKGKITKHYAKFPMKTYGGKNGAIKVRMSSQAFVMFRPSKTEGQLLRIVSDAPTRQQAKQLIDEALDLVG